MTSARRTYFGWTDLAHAEHCKRPNWSVDTRTEHDVRRSRARDSEVDHSCRDEQCDSHEQRYNRTTVRIVCRSCGRAHLVRSEQQPTRTSTDWLGFGQQPRKVAGLLLWPGEPLTTFGMSVRDGQRVPYELLVTGPGVLRPRREDLVGEIAQVLSPRGAVRYGAVACLSPDGRFGHGEYRWSYAAEQLPTIAAAAKWIAAALTAPTSTPEDQR